MSMVKKYPCPRCDRLDAILYGKSKLGNERNKRLEQRILCLSCKRTSYLPYREPFFYRMRTPEDKIFEAIMLYIRRVPIRLIANQLETRPNTIIDWVEKIFKCPLKYKAYLKNVLAFDEEKAYKFFTDLLRTPGKRVTRTDRDKLTKNLGEVFHSDTPKFSCRQRYGR
jgi:transposase-like protein